MTKEEALALFESEFWQDMSHEERTAFQLFEDKLCMPFDIFHEAVEKTLGRPVFTHEFAFPDHLRREFLGDRRPPTVTEILNLIPATKRLLVVHS